MSQPNRDYWKTINFKDANGDAYEFAERPIVVAGPVSFKGRHPASVSIRNVTPTGFEAQLTEPEGWDGWHVTETFQYMAIMPGEHEIDGKKILATSIAGHRYGRGLVTHFSDEMKSRLNMSTMKAFAQTVSSVDEVSNSTVFTTIYSNSRVLVSALKGRTGTTSNHVNVIFLQEGRYEDYATKMEVGSSLLTHIPTGPNEDNLTIPRALQDVNLAASAKTHLMAQVVTDYNPQQTLLRYKYSEGTKSFRLAYQSVPNSKHSNVVANWMIAATNRPSGVAVFEGVKTKKTKVDSTVNVQLTIAADNEATVYLNGVQKLKTGRWWNAEKVNFYELPAGVQHVLAVEARNYGGKAGILIDTQVDGKAQNSSYDWRVIDQRPISTWKITTTANYSDGWTTPSQLGTYGVGPWGFRVSGMPHDTTAQWLWHPKGASKNQTIYMKRLIVPAARMYVYR